MRQIGGLDPLRAISTTLKYFGPLFLAVDIEDLDKELAKLRQRDDEFVRSECRAALGGLPLVEDYAPQKAGWSILRRLRRRDMVLTKHLALGIEAFRRCPADLPPGVELFDEQVQAAMALSSGLLVQMDTGEGKTYALLPAAFALACRHGSVYVVTANRYLAERDAVRTKPYWDWLGVDVGFGMYPDLSNTHQWGRPVVYTTLLDLAFQHLSQAYSSAVSSQYPIRFGAVLLDEADAIILDQAAESGQAALTESVWSDLRDWTFALRFSQELEEGIGIQASRGLGWVDASLTPQGEAELVDRLGTSDPIRHLGARREVELAYIARAVVKEGEDYVVEDDLVFARNLVDGEVRRTQTPEWLDPLEVLLGKSRRRRSITVFRTNLFSLLQRFEHVAGTSGTIMPEALEYLLILHHMAIKIEPRTRRRDGRENDQIYRTRLAADRAVAERAVELADQRPVLVGTQTITRARAVYNMIVKLAGNSRSVLLLVGDDNQYSDREDLFRLAGQAGTIIVSTQVAGRGVDIRLSDQALAGGGLAIIGVGRNVQARLDRQFLGRAGRQGQPWSGLFICSLEDELMMYFATGMIESVMRRLDLPDDMPIESTMVNKAVVRAQNELRASAVGGLQASLTSSVASTSIESGIEHWFRAFHLAIQGEEAQDHEIGGEFIEFAAGRLIQLHVPMLLELDQELELDRGRTKVVASWLSPIAGEPEEELVLKIAGRPVAEVRHEIVSLLKSKVSHAGEENAQFLAALAAVKRLDAIRSSITRVIQGVCASAHQEENGRPETEPQRSLANITVPRLPQLGASLAEWDSWLDGVVALAADPHAEGLVPDLEVAYGRIDSALMNVRKDFLVNRNELFSRRPRTAAYETLRWASSDLSGSLREIEHRARQKKLPPLAYHREVASNMSLYWDAIEAQLAVEVFESLLSIGDPTALDGLFAIVDRRAPTSIAHSTNIPEALRSPVPVIRQDQGKSTDHDLVREFVRRYEEDRRMRLDPAGLVRLLTDFVDQWPLSSLRAPAALDRALLLWEAKDQARVSVWSFRRHRFWLFRFLGFLHQRGYLPNDPSPRWLSKDSITKLVGTLRRPSIALPGIGTIGFLIILVLASLVKVGSNWAPRGIGRVMDLTLSFGLIGRGSIGGPVLFGVMMGFVGVGILKPGLIVRGTALERALAFVGRVAATAFLLIHATEISSVAVVLAVIIVIFFVGRVAGVSTWTLENQGGVRLLSGLVAASCLFVLLPSLASHAGGGTVAIGLLLAGLLVLVLADAANVTRVPVVSLLDTSESAMDGADLNAAFTAKPVQTFYTARLESGWLPHVYALTITWSLVVTLDQLTLSRATLEAVAFATYGLTIFGWTRSHLSGVLDREVWKARLQRSRQLYDPAAGELQDLLRRRRRQGLATELVAQGAVLGLGYLAFGASTVGSTSIPTAIVAASGLAIGVGHGREFCSSLVAVLTSHGAPTGQMHIPDGSEDLQAVVTERLKLWRATVNSRYRFVALAFVVLTSVVNLLGAFDLVRSVLRWATHFIKP